MSPSSIKAERRVTCYYFYLVDAEVGPAFLKICSYFPYPLKLWANGHEGAKRQAAQAGIAFSELANGFASCADPLALQAICDRLGPAEVQAFFDRWLALIPVPFTPKDRAAGYWWELSLRQVEVSRTIVFDAPRRARGFFEALVADNLGTGRPDELKIIFGRRVQQNTPGEFATKVVTRGTEVTVNVFYKHSRLKQYFKEGRALRIETVINDPTDLGCQRRLRNLDQLQRLARAANRRLLEVERVGQACAVTTALLERVSVPTAQGGQRAPALRFGDPRVMALAASLCAVVHAALGFTNRSLCARVSQPLGGLYTTAQCTYDLPAAAQRAHPPAPARQHLRAHLRRRALGALLYQAPGPTARAAARGRPAARLRGAAPRATRHRHKRRRVHRRRAHETCRMKLASFRNVAGTKDP